MLETIKQRIRDFVSERDWEQYHNPKDLAIALSIEASELLESFLWKESGQEDLAEVRQELGDVLIYAFMLADKYELDVLDVMAEKLSINEAKYPAAECRGTFKKYNQ